MVFSSTGLKNATRSDHCSSCLLPRNGTTEKKGFRWKKGINRKTWFIFSKCGLGATAFPTMFSVSYSSSLGSAGLRVSF